MEQIIVKHPDASTTLLVSKGRTSSVTKAEQTVALLGADTVAITVKTAAPITFYLGDQIEVYGKVYTLNQLPTIKKTGARKFEYDLTFEGVQYELIDAQWLLPDNTVLDSFTGDLADFLELLTDNANRVFPGKWQPGTYPADTEFKTLTYTGSNCLEVLQNLCEEYNTEFEIAQANGIRTINIKTAGVNFPYTFRYGRTGGLYELTRQNINSKNVVTRLYVYGGSNNLGDKYRYTKLCLSGKGKNASYIENAAAIAAFGLKENTKTFDEVYPNRYGVVSSLGSKYYAFVDNTMNFDLNEKESDGTTTKWLINGVTAKVKMTSGNLAGYEFEIHKYTHSTKEIQVVPFTDENGMKFPSETSAAFQFGVGDKYIFTDINLPDAYKTEAEAKLQEEGETYYNQYCQPQVQYNLSIDQNFIKQFAGQLTVVNLFAVGDYIPVEDSDLGLAKSVRITGFTRDLLQPYKYSITLGDSVTKTTITRVIEDLQKIDTVIQINDLADPSKARRNWRAAQEVLANVFDPDGNYYSEKIKPLSIETTMLATGARSQQFVLQNTMFEPNYEGNPNTVKVVGGTLVHYTIAETVKSWQLNTATFSNLVSGTVYYIYARCQKTGTAGNIVFDTVQRAVDGDPIYYYFLVGSLSSAITDTDGKRPARLISLTYGATTINGRFITTGRVQTGDGNTYIDLDNNQFRIGNANRAIEYNVNNSGNVKITNATVEIKNTAGQTMVYFSGADGSGRLAKGNISWDSAGNIKANGGTFNDIFVNGAMRTPFRDGYFILDNTGGISVSIPGLQNNNCIVIPGESSGIYTGFNMPFTKDYNGFRATILNTNWGAAKAIGPISATAPSGYYFHEDGETISELVIEANEGVDIIGVGEGNSFKGWCVLNRFRYGVANSGEGFPLKAIFAGKVEFSGGVPRITKQKRYNQYWYGAENKKCQLSYMTNAPRYCTISFPSGTFSSADKYTVLLSGELLRSDNGPGVYASVIKRTANSFTVYTGDDASWNDGNFTFIVIATHLWE